MQTGQTDVTKLIVDVRNFTNAPKSAEYVFLVFDTVTARVIARQFVAGL
jgi:hypothetical protein